MTDCIHEHNEDCYPQDSVSDNTATPSNAEEREPENCDHICDEESGCITKELNCQHEHNSECGYSPAAEGTPCGYVCEICGEETTAAPNEENTVTAASVQAMIDALPEEISEDNAEDVKAQLEAIDKAKTELSDEELDGLDFFRYMEAAAVLEQLLYSRYPQTAVLAEAIAADSTPFATVEQLKSFNTNDNDGERNPAKVYFGNNNQQWWIAGSQNGNLTLFAASPLATGQVFESNYNSNKTYNADWDCDYTSTGGSAPTDVYPNHYGASPLRATLRNWESSNFTDAEQTLMNTTTIYTNDTKNSSVYSTQEKLYLAYGNYDDGQYITVGTNASSTLNGGLRIDKGYWGKSGKFWLRAPYVPYSDVALVAWPGDHVDGNLVYVAYALVPAFELNLSSVIFASAAPAASSDSQLQTSDAYTLRYQPQNSMGTATISQSKQSVTVTDVTNENTYLVVQTKDGAWAKKVSDNDLVFASEISDTLSSFENCKVWLETTTDRITYASEATQGSEVNVKIAAGQGVNVSNGRQANVAGGITDITVEVAEGYYLPDGYENGIQGLNRLTVTNITQNRFTISGTPTSDVNITLPAATPKSYTVTLNKNSGTINSGDITGYTYGTGATLPVDVTKDGYTFKGWYEDSGFSGNPVTAISDTETGNKEYWAKWEANTYTVTLNANGGAISSGNVKNYTYGVGATLPTAGDMTYAGHTFKGWYEQSNFSGNPVTKITVTDIGHKTYYAKWERTVTPVVPGDTGRYIVEHYKANSNDYTLADTEYLAGEIGSTVTATPKTYGGYTYNAEKSTASGQLKKIESERDIVTLKLYYDETFYSVSVENDGNGTASASTTSAAEGTEITLTAKADSGWHFKEWQVVPSGVIISGDKFTMPAENVIVKAIFEKDDPTPPQPAEYTVTVQTKGNGTASPTSAAQGMEITLTATPDKDWHFKEWQVVPGGVIISNNSFTMPAENVTVKAIFEKDGGTTPPLTEYNVTFDGNGGTSPAAQTTTGRKLTSLPTSTQSGYSFNGWYTTKTGGNEITLDTVFTASVTVYAQWTKNSSNGGSSGSGGSSGGGGSSTPTYGSNTLSNSGITLSGSDIHKDARLTVTPNKLHDGQCAGCDQIRQWQEQGRVIAIYDVSLSYGFRGTVTLTFPVSSAYNGKTLTVAHCLKDKLDICDVTVSNGKVTVTADGLSPFAILDNSKDEPGKDNPNTGTENPGTGTENPGTGTGNPFTDVKETDWFYKSVMFVYENGLMVGTSATTFDPNSSATRAQLAVIFYRMEGSPKVEGKNSFTDVEYGPGTAWYYDAVTWAEQSGVVGGYGDGRFGPGDPITREQLAAIFYRYAQYKGYDVTATGSLDRFTDKDKVSEWAKQPLIWAVSSGIVNGTGDNLLSPQGNATRAQIAAMLHRFIEKYGLKPVATSTGTIWTNQTDKKSPLTGDNSTAGAESTGKPFYCITFLI